MRILQINNWSELRGGSDRVFIETGKGLSARGHEVFSFAPVSNLQTTPHMQNPVEIKGQVLPLMSDSHTSRHRNVLAMVYSNKAAKCLESFLNEVGPIDVAHVHIIHSRLTVSVLRVLKRYGIPIVQTAHEYKLVCPIYTLFNESICERCVEGSSLNVILRRCKRRSYSASALAYLEHSFARMLGSRDLVNKFLCISDFQKRLLSQAGIDEDKLSLLRNGTDLDVFKPIENGERQRHYLYFGRLEPEKGITTLLRAFIGTSRELVITGTGSMRPEVEAAAAQHVNIKLHDHLEGEALTQMISRARAVIVPSEWHEPFGLTIIEAKACGTPVIGSMVGAIPELIRPGIDGELFQAGSATSLASALACHEARNAITLSQNARADAVARFGYERYFRDLDSIYKLVIQGYSELLD